MLCMECIWNNQKIALASLDMNIVDCIRLESAPYAAKTAVVEGNNRVSYSQLLSFADTIASDLKMKGVQRFHRIGLLSDDDIDYISTSLAILSLNAVIVPISPEQTETEIEHIIARIDIDFLIFEKGCYLAKDTHLLKSNGFYKKEFFIKRCTVREKPPSEYYKINPAFIRFTSGTTGESKGVVLSHQGIAERTDAADRGLAVTHKDNILWVLSMSFHFVVTILLFLRKGATIILCNHRFPESLIEGVNQQEGTFIYATPFHYNLLTHSEQLASDSLQNIRMAISTAMKLHKNIAADFHAKFGIELSEAYGIIEVGLPFIKFPYEKNKRGSVGRHLPDYEIYLRNKDAEGIGEIYLRGKGMFEAYYSPWQSRDEILNEGWFKTGDLGKVDNENFLTIVGRDKDVINFAGMKVFAQEVEEVLNQFPAVEESYVYGEYHAQYGELPTAKIVLRQGSSRETVIEDLRRFCYRRLAKYKVPKSFQIVSDFPKTESGKIKR